MQVQKNQTGPYWTQLFDAERRIIEFAVEGTNDSVPMAAARLGVPYTFLRRRMIALGMVEVKPRATPTKSRAKKRRRKAAPAGASGAGAASAEPGKAPALRVVKSPSESTP